MARRWINSLDVEFAPLTGAIRTDSGSPTSWVGGSRTASVGSPQPLVAQATPCRFVWIGAPIIIASGLVIVWREHRLPRQAALSAEAAAPT